jgi:two-component system, chemotaxis family, chemotaxis protein CheY
MEYKKILIVDDSTTSRMIIKRCFQFAGYQETEYFEAQDALQAIAFLQNDEVDLVVTDLQMPKMDGNTFIKKLRLNEKTNKLPVVVISSIGNDHIEKELIDIGVQAVIRKPVSPAKIAAYMEI